MTSSERLVFSFLAHVQRQCSLDSMARLNGAAISMTYNQGRPTPHPETRSDLSHNGRPYQGLDVALLSWQRASGADDDDTFPRSVF